MAKRPNILLLVHDHQAYYRHGWDKGIRPRTPHFDQLASQGARFERSYCSSPMCGPSRRTLLTGLYPHNHRNYYNYSNPPYNHEVYLDNLASAGYANYYYGKWHAGHGTAQDFHTEGLSFTDYGNPYTSDAYQEYLARNNLPRAEHHIERIFDNEVFRVQFPNLKEDFSYSCDGYWCGEHAVGITTTPRETHESFFLASLACDRLDQLAASSEEPFHLRVDFWGPHQPHFPTREYAAMYDPEDIPEYGNFREDFSTKPEYYRHDPNKPISNEDDLLIQPNPLNWGEWQHIIARAFAHITMIDDAAGMILNKLEELGLAENTMVMWTGDHGDALASHGGHFDKGSYMTEEVIRVPLAIRWPGRIEPGQVLDEFVSGVDIAPTILDAAGTGFINPVDGTSFLPLFQEPAPKWREDLLVETYGHGFGTREIGRLVLWKDYKYVHFQNYGPELYDLQADPYELHNIINHPDLQDTVRELSARLQRLLDETGDKDFDKPISEEFIKDDEASLHELFVRRGLA